MKVAT